MERRGFMKIAAVSTGAALFVPGALAGCRLQTTGSAESRNPDVMEEALEMMGSLAPLGNHGPMAVEALISLGRPERTIRFVESYKRRFTAVYPIAFQAVTAGNWKEALGDGRRNRDWVNYFDRELKENPWKRVVEKWTDILAPGLSAAAGHGVIRTCHAVRSLTLKQTERRLYELAEGLGYWAAYYQPLPERYDPKIERLGTEQAIANVPLVPEERRRRGSIMDQLRALDDFPPFAGSVNLIDTSGDPEQVISVLTETLADVYLKNVSSRNHLLLLHALTAAAGIRSLLPYLSPPTIRKTLIYGWQTAAGLYAIGATGVLNRPAAKGEVKRDYLIDRSVELNEEHAIKFTEACLREYSLNPKGIYLQAADDSLRRLPSFS